MSGLRSALVALTLVPFLAGACSSAANGSTPTTTARPAATVHDMSDMAGMSGMEGMPGTGTASTGKVECAQHMPGDLLTAEQAMVIFDTEHVCLGYVTVTAGTAITFHNADDAEHRVVIQDGNGTPLMTFDILGGGATQRALKTPGVYRYTVSAIESFVGTIEVQAA